MLEQPQLLLTAPTHPWNSPNQIYNYVYVFLYVCFSARSKFPLIRGFLTLLHLSVAAPTAVKSTRYNAGEVSALYMGVMQHVAQSSASDSL